MMDDRWTEYKVDREREEIFADSSSRLLDYRSNSISKKLLEGGTHHRRAGIGEWYPRKG
jgi:hypothetical protein